MHFYLYKIKIFSSAGRRGWWNVLPGRWGWRTSFPLETSILRLWLLWLIALLWFLPDSHLTRRRGRIILPGGRRLWYIPLRWLLLLWILLLIIWLFFIFFMAMLLFHWWGWDHIRTRLLLRYWHILDIKRRWGGYWLFDRWWRRRDGLTSF